MRPRKQVIWIVVPAYCFIILHPTLTCVNQPKALLTSERYHATIAINEHNGWETTGRYRKIRWRKKYNSLREMWWDQSLGPFHLP